MSITLGAFLWELGRVESSHRWFVQNTSSGAYGYYQVMPANWKAWAPKALDTDPTLAVARADLPGAQWLPEPTAANQQATVEWRLVGKTGTGGWYHNVYGDWRRVAAAWRSGGTVASRQPGETRADGTYYWTSGTLKYVNNVCIPLGFAETTRTTILPPLVGEVEAPVEILATLALTVEGGTVTGARLADSEIDALEAQIAALETANAALTAERDALNAKVAAAKAALA